MNSVLHPDNELNLTLIPAIFDRSPKAYLMEQSLAKTSEIINIVN